MADDHACAFPVACDGGNRQRAKGGRGFTQARGGFGLAPQVGAWSGHAGAEAARSRQEPGQAFAWDAPSAGLAARSTRRAVFQKINQAIIAAAQQDLPTILSVAQPLIPQMNLVNLSTVLHRVARMSGKDPEACQWLRAQPVLWDLLATTSATLDREVDSAANPRTQAFSNITWALSTVEILDLPLLGRITSMAQPTLATFKPFELSGMLWSLAKLTFLDLRVREMAAPLFVQAAPLVSQEFNFRCLVMLAWAYATVGCFDQGVFHFLGDLLLPEVRNASSAQLANIGWAFRAAEVQHSQLLHEIQRSALQKVDDFGPEELVDVLGSRMAAEVAAGLVPHLHFAAGAEGATAVRSDVSAASVSSCRVRCLPLQVCQPIVEQRWSPSPDAGDEITSSAAASLQKVFSSECLEVVEDKFAGAVDAAATSELRQCLVAAAAMGSTELQPVAAQGDTNQQASRQRWACTVRNTFLDVDVGGGHSEEDHPHLKALGPPLDIMQANAVDAEQLEAFRMSYQRFRCGKASGARGEVSRCVTKDGTMESTGLRVQ